MVIFVGRIMRSFRESTQFKSAAYHLQYLFECKPRLIKFFFQYLVRLTTKGGLQSRAAYIFSLGYRQVYLDDVQSFFGYVSSTKLCFRILFSSASRAHPSHAASVFLRFLKGCRGGALGCQHHFSF